MKYKIKFSAVILSILSAASLTSGQLTNSEWELIDTTLPLTDAINADAIANECVTVKFQELKWSKKLVWNQTKKLRGECMLEANAKLEAQHQSILRDSHPVFTGYLHQKHIKYLQVLNNNYWDQVKLTNDEWYVLTADGGVYLNGDKNVDALARHCIKNRQYEDLDGVDLRELSELCQLESAKRLTMQQDYLKNSKLAFLEGFQEQRPETYFKILLNLPNLNYCVSPLTRSQWLLIDPELPLMDEKNVLSIGGDLELTKNQLIFEHYRIRSLSHPYYDGASVNAPPQYYETLIFQYGFDINTENPLKLAKQNKNCKALASLLEINILFELHVDSEWILMQPEFYHMACFTSIVKDPRVKIDTEAAKTLFKNLMAYNRNLISYSAQLLHERNFFSMLTPAMKKEMFTNMFNQKKFHEAFFEFLITEKIISPNEDYVIDFVRSLKYSLGAFMKILLKQGAPYLDKRGKNRIMESLANSKLLSEIGPMLLSEGLIDVNHQFSSGNRLLDYADQPLMEILIGHPQLDSTYFLRYVENNLSKKTPRVFSQCVHLALHKGLIQVNQELPSGKRLIDYADQDFDLLLYLVKSPDFDFEYARTSAARNNAFLKSKFDELDYQRRFGPAVETSAAKIEERRENIRKHLAKTRVHNN